MTASNPQGRQTRQAPRPRALGRTAEQVPIPKPAPEAVLEAAREKRTEFASEQAPKPSGRAARPPGRGAPLPGLEHPAEHIGIDEAGRGCLAGPVVAGAVLFSPNFDFAAHLPGLDDSKRLTEDCRKRLAAAIPRHCLAHGVGLAWQDEIDAVNILIATFRAMCRAVLALTRRLERRRGGLPDMASAMRLPHLLIDGNQCIPREQWLFCAGGMPVGALAWEQYFPLPLSSLPVSRPDLPPQRAVVDGDALVPAISAASVLAKSVRDGLMERLDEHFPAYGFRCHKGYGTKEHLAALGRHGPCLLHRQSFRRVRPEGESRGPEQLSLW